MWRTFLLAACAAPATALPFGFGRRKGEVLASPHEIAADLADLETNPVDPATVTTNTQPQPTVVNQAPQILCGPLPAAVAPQVHVVAFKLEAGLAILNTPALTTTVQNTVDTSSTGGTLVSDSV